MVVALVAGLMGVHQTVGQGLSKLFGAGFFVWGVHLGIAFAVPWMTSWTTHLPGIGEFAPSRSVAWAHMLFDLAVASGAWMEARRNWSGAPLWLESASEPSPPLPPPPPLAKKQI